MFGLPFIDILMIILYFGMVMLIGIWASRRIKSQEDYFLAGRRFGKFIQTFAAFGQGTSADTAISSVVFVARNGLAGIWMSMLSVFGLPIYWLTSVWYRRLRLITLGDFFEERYNSKGLAALYTIINSVMFMLVIAIAFSAMAKTVVAITIKPVSQLTVEEKAEYQLSGELQELKNTDVRLLTDTQKQRLHELQIQNPRREFSYLNERLLVAIVAVVVIVYAVLGGLEAAFLTDTLQGVFIIILSIILFPFALVKANMMFDGQGVSGIIEIVRSQLSQSMFEIWGSPVMMDFTFYFIIVGFIMNQINVGVQANQLTSTGSAKDEYTARYGFCAGIYIKRWTTLFWGVTALILIVIYSSQVSNPDYIWGIATRDLLGPLGLGLVGLMIACLMAALMSTADCLMITTSGLVTHNILRPFFPDYSESFYVWMGRIFGAIFIINCVIIAYMFDNIFDMIKLLWEFNVSIAASFWLGMKWRRANRFGAWCSMLSTLTIFTILPLVISFFSSIKANEYLSKTTESIKVDRVYTARAVDIEKRQKEIELWEKLDAKGLIKTQKPAPLIAGQKFEKEYLTPSRSIFWSQGLRQSDDGVIYGKGMLFLEMTLLDKMGFDLSTNPYALNETIRFSIRMIWPFVILFIFAKLTKPDDKSRLDRFYVKMKTPVCPDKEKDEEQMEISCANPYRFDDKKMFPNTNWEFEKFDKADIKGIVGYTVAGLVILFAVYMVSLIGV